MASLVGQQLKDTYDSLLKTSDNDALGGTYKEITDGSGNGSNLYLGTSGRVGIGVSSPENALHVAGNQQLEVTSPIGTSLLFTNNAVNQFSADKNYHLIDFNTSSQSSETTGGYVRIKAGQEVSGNDNRSYLSFWTAPNGGTVSEKMRIKSDGDISFRDGSANEAFYWDASTARLGIGTTSPGTNLHIEDSSGATLRLTTPASGGTSTIQVLGYDSANVSRLSSAIDFQSVAGSGTANGHIIFSTYPSNSKTERMRIDSSGTVMVGKTATGLTNIGVELFQSGGMTATRSGDVVQYLNRTTSDGTILEFRKDNTAVGSIGTEGGDLTIGNGDTGVQFGDAGDYIRPWNISTNTARDNAVDLGVSTARFKDLYLGGSVYLGGTTSANALDDYEEGTWTPTLEGSTTAGTYTFSTNESLYTKIGRQVTVISRLIVDTASGGSGTAKFGGLPFTKLANSGFQGAVRLKNVDVDNSTINLTAVTWTYSATTEFAIATTLDNASGSGIDIAGISSGDTIEFSFTYFV